MGTRHDDLSLSFFDRLNGRSLIYRYNYCTVIVSFIVIFHTLSFPTTAKGAFNTEQLNRRSPFLVH